MATTTRYNGGMTILGTLIAAPVAYRSSGTRSEMVRVLLTPEELARVIATAEAMGTSRSDAIVRMARLREAACSNNEDRCQIAALGSVAGAGRAPESTNGMRVRG